ncbi:MAG: response regulator, partial [bacterium]|nr:response regulator [bacterium]
QVLLNLLENAIKFTKEGEANLTINQVPDDDPSPWRVEVADTGIGIPAENRDRLFEAFTQHDASSTRIHGGSGLGLAISRRLVEMMGGQLTVESEDGQGSVFGFDIVYNATGNVEILNLLPMTCLTGLNVLIADRMPMNRRAAVSILQDCCCEEAEDVDSLFQQLHTATAIGNPYDLVLIDHGLAPDEIEDVICRIKQGAKTSCPKLIVTRLMGQRRDVDRLVPGLIDATISKPLKSRQVFRTLCDLFSGETVSETHAESSGAGSRTTTLPSEPTRMRVLIAEDNVINQKVALGILEKLEYIPVLVGNGQEALRALQNAHFDLVLMDVQMPGMDGFEATRMIRLGRAGERNTNIPILAMTAYAMREDRERCLKVGMNDYIAKPVTVEQLGAKLDTWLRNKKATGRGARGSDQ